MLIRKIPDNLQVQECIKTLQQELDSG